MNKRLDEQINKIELKGLLTEDECYTILANMPSEGGNSDVIMLARYICLHQIQKVNALLLDKPWFPRAKDEGIAQNA